MRIGVYICECGVNIGANVDVEKVAEQVKSLPYVTVSRYYKYMCSDPGQELIKKDIKEFSLDRVVVASCSPRMHEPTFRTAVQEAGLNPYCFEMANIREQCSWVHENREKATEKATVLIAGAVARASFLKPLEKKEVSVIPKALVIGGGIAGIQAAMEIADKGFKVYLVERTPSIGGRMAQLDKTFPTLDCSACILTPKMVDVSRHPNIELLTYAEVVDLGGYIGNFKVKVKKRARYVDVEKCIGCGECAEVCRLKNKIPNEFDVGLGKRGAIYVPFPQAVPLKYTIDQEHCIFLKFGKCGDYPPCKNACKADAIDFEQKEETVELEVGTLIVATGFDLFDPKLKPEYSYGKYDNVITGLEFERLCNASGPTSGNIQINGKKPKKVVFIQCVGSRDKKIGNEYCSRVCCMYTAKQAHLVKEKIPNAELTVLYTDVRAFGKGFEEFYNRVQNEGVTYKRRELDDPIKVVGNGDGVIVKAKGHKNMEADLVVLATGITPKKDTKEIVRILNINQSADGFLLEAHPKLRPMDTFTDGIYIAGCCQSPKDIPDTVAQASGAASRVCDILSKKQLEVEATVAKVDETMCRGCGFCVEVCPYDAIKLKEVTQFGHTVEIAEVNEVLCKGCGACSAACLSGAIQHNGFTDGQVLAMISALGE